MSEQFERDNGLTYPISAVRSAYGQGKREGREERDREWLKCIAKAVTRPLATRPTPQTETLKALVLEMQRGQGMSEYTIIECPCCGDIAAKGTEFCDGQPLDCGCKGIIGTSEGDVWANADGCGCCDE